MNIYLYHVFSIAAVTNYHNLFVVENDTNLLFYSSEGQKSDGVSLGQKKGVNRVVFLLKALEGSLFPCSFHLLEADCIFSLTTLFLHLQSQPQLGGTHMASLWPLLPVFIFKDPCDLIGPPRRTQDNLTLGRQVSNNFHSSCKLNSPLPRTLTYSQVLGIRMWTSLGTKMHLHFFTYFGANKVSKELNSFPKVSGPMPFSEQSEDDLPKLFSPKLSSHSNLQLCFECVLAFALYF